MHRFFLKTPGLFRRLFPGYVWRMPATEHAVYLTFDDGPHPEVTPWVLDQLQAYEAKATFFCIGHNVALYPQIYERILAEGHSVGNHTYNHLNGWKAETEVYLEEVRATAALVSSRLFRPPYGRIRGAQAEGISSALDRADAQIIMWDVLSADFDRSFTPARCARTVIRHTEPGSIIVFHDSEKARVNLEGALPRVLEAFRERAYVLRAWSQA